MLAKYSFYLRRKRGEARNRFRIRSEVGFRAIKPNGGGVVGIAGKEQAVGAVEKADGVRRVTGRGEYLDGAAAKIDGVAVMDVLADGPRLGAIRFCVEIFRKVAADFAGSDFRLGIRAGTLGIARLKSVSME